ncbi:MAG: hypothetical protein U5J98_04750 [Halobacteriales archaeon]|nr:hypothetical protein [Halobacteriales archaeon]
MPGDSASAAEPSASSRPTTQRALPSGRTWTSTSLLATVTLTPRSPAAFAN